MSSSNPNRHPHKLERSNATSASSPVPVHSIPSMQSEVAGTTATPNKSVPDPCGEIPEVREAQQHGRSILGPPVTPPPQISVLSRESSTESSGSYSSESSPVGKLGLGIQDLQSKMDKRRTFSESGCSLEMKNCPIQNLEIDPNHTNLDTQEKELESRSRRTRSLNAPSPIQQFGPCGRIMKNSAMVMQIQDPAFQRLTWYKTPLTVLVIKKTRDVSVLSPFVQLTRWLIEEKRMVVHIESAVLDDNALVTNPQFVSIREKLQVFREGRDDLTDKIDFIICLGGDGTLLYASSLFQQSVPPVMAFHLGSLGFLTPFLFDNFQEQVTNVLEGHAALTLRSRLKCILKRRSSSESAPPGSVPVIKNGPMTPTTNGIDKTANNHRSNAQHPSSSALNFLVLNEVVVDRGPSPYLSNVDLFIDGKHVTVVQGDGLIVSTPTGSTAYAVAAGASMIHPSVPAIMITPICPHSLSFRPIVVPAGVELKIKISPDSRNTAWVSFDGRNRQELHHGDALSVTTSVYPVPSICAQDQIQDWFDSLADCLQWNVRKRQKTFEDGDEMDNSDSYDLMES